MIIVLDTKDLSPKVVANGNIELDIPIKDFPVSMIGQIEDVFHGDPDLTQQTLNFMSTLSVTQFIKSRVRIL